jgi:hypothetical protein
VEVLLETETSLKEYKKIKKNFKKCHISKSKLKIGPLELIKKRTTLLNTHVSGAFVR